MEDSAIDTVVHGTLITSTASAFISGLYSISRRSPSYALIATAAAVNSGVTAATFFTLREFVVSPILVHALPWTQYAWRRHNLGISKMSDPLPKPQTYSDLRKYKTLDTGLSGAITGGALRGWKSGPRSILPGALTVGAICTLLQLACNEAGIVRLHYVSSLNAPASVHGSTEPASSDPTSKPAVLNRFLAILGIHQVTEEEYLEKLKASRASHLERITELEQKLAEEKQERL